MNLEPEGAPPRLPVFQVSTPHDFDERLSGAGDDLVVVYFWGPDCPNCDVFAAELPTLLPRLPTHGLTLLKVNAYEHTELARRFGLFGIPAFVLFHAGKRLGMMRQYNGRDYWVQVLQEQHQARGSRPA